MSVQKVLIDLYPAYDFYMKDIDPRIGIFSTANIEELIINEVMILYGVEYTPSMNRLKEVIYSNLVTDIADDVYTKFTNIAFDIFNRYSFDNAREIIIRPRVGFSLEVSYHIPMSLGEVQNYMSGSHAPAA